MAGMLTDAQRATLLDHMGRGVMRVRMPDSSEVQYASLADMQKVLDRDDQARARDAGGSALSYATWARD